MQGAQGHRSNIRSFMTQKADSRQNYTHYQIITVHEFHKQVSVQSETKVKPMTWKSHDSCLCQ